VGKSIMLAATLINDAGSRVAHLVSLTLSCGNDFFINPEDHASSVNCGS